MCTRTVAPSPSGTYSMEPATYEPVPNKLAEEVLKEARERHQDDGYGEHSAQVREDA